jgi:hypothetical protein
MTRLPSQTDLAVAPELGILAALRVTLHLVADTLHVVHPLSEPPRDPEAHAAHTILLFVEALRLALHDYERLAADRC